MSKWEDIADELTDEGFEALNVKNLIVFENPETKVKTRLVVMRKDKKNRKLWCRKVDTYALNELELHEYCDVDLNVVPMWCKTHKQYIRNTNAPLPSIDEPEI